MKNWYDLEFKLDGQTVTKFIRDDLDYFKYFPEKLGLWSDGERRVWGIQYVKSSEILTPEFIEALHQAGVKDDHNEKGMIAFFRGRPKSSMHIHVDGGSTSAINVSWNAPNSRMLWWKPKLGERPFGKASITGRFAPSYKEEQCNYLDSKIILQPTLVRTDIPHSVIVPDDTPRWGISIRNQARPWPTWAQAVEQHRHIIKE